MSKTTDRRVRRKRSRMNYLANLAKRDLDAFSREWRRLVEGWSYEIRRRALSLVDDHGQPTELSFRVIEEVGAVLRDCSIEAYEREWPATSSVLTHMCCVAVSQATGRALSPRTFMQRFQSLPHSKNVAKAIPPGK